MLLVPDFDASACSSAQDDIIVEIHTGKEIVGVGEVDTNPRVAQAMIHARGAQELGRGLEEMLIGQDPLQEEALWEKLFIGSYMIRNASFYMSFVDREGWQCQFLEADLKTTLPKRLHLTSPDRIIELVERGGGFPGQESLLMVDREIALGRGGVFLNLADEQYVKLRR